MAAILILLAACGDDGDRVSRPPTAPSEWAIGAPERQSTATTFTIPTQGSVNYVTKATGALEGKTRITLTYRIDMAEGVQIVPASVPEQMSIITLYFQREGDDWSGAGEYEAYRWFATSKSQMPITAGTHEITASLTDDRWTAIQTSDSNSPLFAQALASADRIGFVLGGGTGYGHGVRATGAATFTIISYEIN